MGWSWWSYPVAFFALSPIMMTTASPELHKGLLRTALQLSVDMNITVETTAPYTSKPNGYNVCCANRGYLT
eukprot:5694571-Alexandrium_andersonii.AAC.1